MWTVVVRKSNTTFACNIQLRPIYFYYPQAITKNRLAMAKRIDICMVKKK